MPPRAPSIKTLAARLGLSRTTVSDALRGKGRVSEATVQRVQAAAKAVGYRPNPLIAAVLGAIHHPQRVATFRGTLAVVDLYEQGHWPHGPFTRALVEGIKHRAGEMGFSIGEFVVGSEVLPWRRFDGILRSRGIHGIIVLPAWAQPDLSAFDWSEFAGIYTDHVTAQPALHSVCADHYGSMLSLLTLLEQRGYRRPGLILERGRDERIRYRQRAAYCAWQTARGERDVIPPLITADYPDVKREFVPWFRRHKPDVVLSHFVETPDWMKACLPSVTTGFVLLNVLEKTTPCAALDLQPRILGARAVEHVVGQILRAEFGVPEWPSRSMVQARWVEGPTVRPPVAAGATISPVALNPA